MSERIAVFDFDGTLTRRDSFPAFARFALGRGRLMLAMLREAPWLASWKLGLIPGGRAKERLFGRLFKGMPVKEFDRLGQRFAAEITAMERPQTVSALQRCVADGTAAYVVTASIRNWVQPWADSRGVSAVIATEAEVAPDGTLTGRFATPNCTGAEKTRRLAQIIGPLDRYEITAYGDSAGDDALLAVASKAFRIWSRRSVPVRSRQRSKGS